LFLHYVAAIDVEERKFYGVLTVILTMATAAMTLNNEISLHDPNEVWTNVISYFQWILAVWLLFRLPSEQPDKGTGRDAGLLADLVNIGSPVMLSAILLALGFAVQARQPSLGLIAIVAAFAAFFVRSTLYLRSFEQAQRSLERARSRLETLSYTDELTGVANRRAFDVALEMEWQQGLRSGAPLSLIFIDVDYFKQLNDTAGHQTGDLVLQKIANALRSALPRSIDVLGRYGGDEFAAILPSTNAAAAATVAERLIHAVQALALPHPATSTGHATISLGIGSCDHAAGAKAADLLAAADSALYEAKAAGRNGWRSLSL
jgi:diguanylate cyclase (GGDEF)-like protein